MSKATRHSGRRLAIIAALLCLCTALASSQTTPPDKPSKPEFDVASVRQNKTGGSSHSNVPLDSGNLYTTINPGDSRTAAGGFFVAIHQPLWRFISFAYHLSGTQEMALRFNYFSGMPKSGAPTWVTGTFDAPGDFFDIEARAEPGTTIDEMRLMMQALLADRFHLAIHHQTAAAPALALVLSRPGATGPNLQPHPSSDPCSAPDPTSATPTTAQVIQSPLGDLPPICDVIAHVPSATNPRESYGARRVPLSLLATSLPTMTGLAILPRPVVDQTGLTGLYDFTLHWTASPDPNPGDTAASFREALKKQLGLELKPTRAPLDILVVDHVDHPSEN